MRFGGDRDFVLVGKQATPRTVEMELGEFPITAMVYEIEVGENATHPGTLVLFPGLPPEEFFKAVAQRGDA